MSGTQRTAGLPTGGATEVADEHPVEDVLGQQWVARTLALRPDALARRGAPAPVATLVSPAGSDEHPRAVAVLYVHGFTDYFFHAHVGAFLGEHGYDLHALDLRDHGRSIRPGRPPTTTSGLGAHAEEIDLAVRRLRRRYASVVLLGHSTGGLVTALWADARRGLGLVDGLVLNSPWLDLRGGWLTKHAVGPLASAIGRVAPDAVVSHLGPHYARALHAEGGGEWTFEQAWKPFAGFPVHAGFVRAVRDGQRRVARGLDVDVPVLVLTSDAAGRGDRWHEGLLSADCVLDPADIRARAPRLGRDVRLVEVPGGAHDLALSAVPARDVYLAEVLAFLRTHAPAHPSSGTDPSTPAHR
ncbi:alpha/beta hydrolase [Cellulomonas marina]|uniref:Lysophospholipase, alpha-beta hydrolase superfamily n=1 Tax=Cellulomonas marina TaxID=988821 RepID=A0A1I1AIZ2_9CELL|nr:alpha/beta hydrolase [Cellulomonas marina]GIG30133.1 alpha/beta hydrolase [Cellulomonas marina]SFB37984.1 Lysophospholipase, alpha-beta hydrolase superfamily [Cellulomonas marina]